MIFASLIRLRSVVRKCWKTEAPPGFSTRRYSSYFYHFTVMMVFLNCCVNPVIYFVKYQEFQQAARRVLGLRGAGGSVAAEQTASTAGQ